MYGLRSEIPAEQDFALHHLVKVSFERGEKYRFEGFPQLAEALLEKTLEVSTLIHGIRWKVSYDGPGDADTLDAVSGTPGLLERLQVPALPADSLETPEAARALARLNESSLVIRNMCMLEENAAFIARFALLKDFLVICLNLPDDEHLAELRQNVLDTAELVTKHWELDSTSPVYQSLVRCLWSPDRGAILAASRAISRIGMDGPKANQLTNIPLTTVKTLIAFLLLDDDELVLAALDILYQYTALPQNQVLLWSDDEATVRQLIPRLVKLLFHNAKQSDHKIQFATTPEAPVTDVQVVPDDLYSQLLTYPEPERSTQWLRCCFEESPNVDITQITIWQAYQGRFLQNNPMAASDFIKNVSTTFTSAQAQVVPGSTPRFIIKGIRPKLVITDPSGTPFMRCLWGEEPCMSWHRNGQKLWEHLVEDHFEVPRNADGKFSATTGSYRCEWANCTKHARTPETSAAKASQHVRVHIPVPGKTKPRAKPDAEHWHSLYNTPMDELGPVGIPYMAVLVLKNFARFALRHQSQGAETLMETLFDDVKTELWRVITFNRHLRVETHHLMQIISQGSPAPRQARRSTGGEFGLG